LINSREYLKITGKTSKLIVEKLRSNEDSFIPLTQPIIKEEEIEQEDKVIEFRNGDVFSKVFTNRLDNCVHPLKFRETRFGQRERQVWRSPSKSSSAATPRINKSIYL
jgi:hypothetical protein